MRFNANEIFEIAIQIERNGHRFYKQSAANITDHEVKKLLEGLAQAEIKHEETFTAMKETFLGPDQQLAAIDPDSDAERYLHAMADGYVFNFDEASKLDEITNSSAQNILLFALGREKDSILYYLGLKELVPTELGKNEVDKIIREEMNHVTIIGKYLKALKSR